MTLLVTNSASDPDGDQLTFSLGPGAATNATINATNGLFSWSPAQAQIGSNVFNVIVTDNGFSPLSATQSFVVAVVHSNTAPVLAAISNQTVAVGVTLVVTNAASDPDGDQLTFSLGPGAATNASIDAASGIFTWTPTQAQLGSNAFTVVVTDNGLPPLSANQDFTVTVVVPSNNPPVLAPIADRTIHAQTTLTFTNSASDPDAPPQVLTFSLGTGAPTGANIDPTNGVFVWTPSDSQIGSNNITVQVTDNGSPPLSDSKSFLVTVRPRPILNVVSVSTNGVNFSWDSIAGTTYRLQLKANLTDSSWTDLPPDITATGPTATANDPSSTQHSRFYRLTIVQ
jgi:hypothetical protein